MPTFKRKYSDDEIKQFAVYMVKKKCTIKETADKYKVAWSTMRRYMRITLRDIDTGLWAQVSEVIANNIARTLKNFNKINKSRKKKKGILPWRK